MVFPFSHHFIPLGLDHGRDLGGLVVSGLSSFSPFLVFDIFGKSTVVSVPVASLKLVDGIGIRVVSVDGIRAYFLFFAGV